MTFLPGARGAAAVAALVRIVPVCGGWALAQEPPLYEFGEIVVTGEQPRVADEVATVDIVTAEEIERSGARTVDEAIALLPGGRTLFLGIELRSGPCRGALAPERRAVVVGRAELPSPR